IIDNLLHANHGVIKSKKEIHAIGHRMVHGAEIFTHPVIITEAVIEQTRKCCKLAPLHNPANLIGIESALEILPGIPQCGIYDTAFHQTMPKHAYLYSIPMSLYKKHGIRRYGFHGTSHQFVSEQAADLLKMDYKKMKIITCHLGNGSSIAAIKYGKSVDTSMGMTPLEGLMMGTRSGDIDPALIQFIAEEEKMSAADVTNILLNKKSGMLGVTGISNDMRDVHEAIAKGNLDAKAGLDIFCYRLKKYIGSYIAAMNGVDVIVFTGGIGELDDIVREHTMSELDWLGIKIDNKVNEGRKFEVTMLSTPDSKVKVMVIPTNEEFMIARETAKLVNDMKHSEK
ncbi:MAG: acetate kinase, partial [Candidatus Wallbacteria bacterium GWC2_49_35]